MKKLLFLGAMAAMLLGTASCSKDMEPTINDGTVQFKVELPGNIDSRAISDGTTAIKLDVACYDEDGNYLDIEPTVKTDFDNLEATVVYKLAKGQKYNFAFFAHCEDRTTNPDPYFSRTNRYLFEHGDKFEDCKFVFGGLHQTSDFANDEKRDAFYGTLTNYELTSEETTVTLIRPFAQINIGTDDLQEAIASGIKPRNVRVEFSKVSKSFNIASGMASEDETETGWYYYYPNYDEEGNMPYEKNPAENLTVDGKEYTWISMNYILVPANEANIDVKVKVHTTKTATGENGEDFTFDVNNVPVKKNHRTNIVGSLLTKDANLKVVINPIYEQPDYNVDPEATVFNITTNDELDAALHSDAKKIVINLPAGRFEYKTSAYNSIPGGTYGGANTQSITIKGAGVDQTTFVGKTTYWSYFTTTNPDCVLTLKDLTVTSEGNSASTWDGYDYAIDCGDFKADNVKFLKPVSFCNVGQKSEMNNVYIDATNTPSDAYGIWQEAGTNLTLENCTINAVSTNGKNNRGLKISDQYLSNLQISYLKIVNCTFKSNKKAAILVGTKAGANITVDGIDITGVAADQINAVWVDGNYVNYSNLVTVTGATCIDEP